MRFITGTPRDQIFLVAQTIDEIISINNPVRFIDAYVDKLDLRKIGIVIPGSYRGRGRPPYSPATMLKLYIYGYLNKIRSSRKLENECYRNNEINWLICMLRPDFKSIADFRKTNKEGIKNIFSEFLYLCKKLNLLSFKCVAVDGTKLRAKNHLENIYKKDTIDGVEKAIQEKINNYLLELEKNDESEESEFDFLSKNIVQRLSKLNKKSDKIEIIKKMFEENPEMEKYFANDPDSRLQKDNGRISAGYNCQAAVDEKHKLIIATEVTNESNDLHQLNDMKEKIVELKEELEIDNKTVVVADAGYFQEKEIMKAQEDGKVEVFVSHPRDSQNQKTKIKENKDKIPSKEFGIDNFNYDRENNIFTCPEGKVLTRIGASCVDKQSGTCTIKYLCHDCNGCKSREKCTSSKVGRQLQVSTLFNELKDFRDKCNTKLGKKILSKRKEIVEHPFGTIKHNWGYRYFMQKGNEKVSAEFSFISFVYNLRRVLNIVPFDELMDALETI